MVAARLAEYHTEKPERRFSLRNKNALHTYLYVFIRLQQMRDPLPELSMRLSHVLWLQM